MAAGATVRVIVKPPSRMHVRNGSSSFPAMVGLERQRPLPSRGWEGPLVASARRYSERTPPPIHRSPRPMRPRAVLRRRTLARCMNANLDDPRPVSRSAVDKRQNRYRLPFDHPIAFEFSIYSCRTAHFYSARFSYSRLLRRDHSGWEDRATRQNADAPPDLGRGVRLTGPFVNEGALRVSRVSYENDRRLGGHTGGACALT